MGHQVGADQDDHDDPEPWPGRGAGGHRQRNPRRCLQVADSKVQLTAGPSRSRQQQCRKGNRDQLGRVRDPEADGRRHPQRPGSVGRQTADEADCCEPNGLDQEHGAEEAKSAQRSGHIGAQQEQPRSSDADETRQGRSVLVQGLEPEDGGQASGSQEAGGPCRGGCLRGLRQRLHDDLGRSISVARSSNPVPE